MPPPALPEAVNIITCLDYTDLLVTGLKLREVTSASRLPASHSQLTKLVSELTELVSELTELVSELTELVSEPAGPLAFSELV